MSSRLDDTRWASIAATAARLSPIRPACIARCNSSSVGTVDLARRTIEKFLGAGRFVEQNAERRYVIVPFDQGRNRPETPKRFLVKRPDLGAHSWTAIIDPQRPPVRHGSGGVASLVKLPKGRGRQCRQIGRGVPAVILRAHVDV